VHAGYVLYHWAPSPVHNVFILWREMEYQKELMSWPEYG
jgi:hypothetical protein